MLACHKRVPPHAERRPIYTKKKNYSFISECQPLQKFPCLKHILCHFIDQIQIFLRRSKIMSPENWLFRSCYSQPCLGEGTCYTLSKHSLGRSTLPGQILSWEVHLAWTNPVLGGLPCLDKSCLEGSTLYRHSPIFITWTESCFGISTLSGHKSRFWSVYRVSVLSSLPRHNSVKARLLCLAANPSRDV